MKIKAIRESVALLESRDTLYDQVMKPGEKYYGFLFILSQLPWRKQTKKRLEMFPFELTEWNEIGIEQNTTE